MTILQRNILNIQNRFNCNERTAFCILQRIRKKNVARISQF